MKERKSEIPDQEIDLLDYVTVVIKHRKKIIRNVIVVALVTVIISFFLPKIYTAVTTILPPEETQSTGILTTLSNSPLANLILKEKGTTSDLFVEIIKSRSVFDAVLKTEFIY
jgi:uncharacterized protein involved in exopolysaccharide biosynthesis